MMDPERLERLKERFQFDQWAADGDSRPQQSAGDVDPRTLIPDWQLTSVESGGVEDLPKGVRSISQSVWQAEEGDEERALIVNVFECDSPFAAREHLLEQLNQFESPLMERLKGEEELGEVAFSHPGRHVALFARGNRVVVIKNAGTTPISTVEIAREVDHRLVREGSPD